MKYRPGMAVILDISKCYNLAKYCKEEDIKKLCNVGFITSINEVGKYIVNIGEKDSTNYNHEYIDEFAIIDVVKPGTELKYSRGDYSDDVLTGICEIDNHYQCIDPVYGRINFNYTGRADEYEPEDSLRFHTVIETATKTKLKDDPNLIKSSALDVKDITLLSYEEAKNLSWKVRSFDYSWWLKTENTVAPGLVAIVIDDGSSSFEDPDIDTIAVRPALVISNLNRFDIPLNTEVTLDNETSWLRISDDMLLCNCFAFGQHRFDAKSANYETSEIKQYIYDKAKTFNLVVMPIGKKRALDRRAQAKARRAEREKLNLDESLFN